MIFLLTLLRILSSLEMREDRLPCLNVTETAGCPRLTALAVCQTARSFVCAIEAPSCVAIHPLLVSTLTPTF